MEDSAEVLGRVGRGGCGGGGGGWWWWGEDADVDGEEGKFGEGGGWERDGGRVGF